MELLQALGDWQVAAAIRRSGTLYPLLNAAHILSLGMLVGTIVTLDLRVLGLFRASPLAALAPPLTRIAAIAAAGAVVTGFLLFSIRPVAYAQNPAFLAKLAFVAIGLTNALLLHLGAGWARALKTGSAGARVKAGAVLSLFTWLAAIVSGRWIGFLQ